MRLRHVLLVSTAVSSVGLWGFSGAAFAAGASPVPAAYDWTGFYAGVGVGIGSGSPGSIDWSETGSAIESLLPGSGTYPIMQGGTLSNFPPGGSGMGLKGDVGYNQQMDNFLLGVEASIMSGPFSSTATYTSSGTVSYITTSLVPTYSNFGYVTTTDTTVPSSTLVPTTVPTYIQHTFTETQTITNTSLVSNSTVTTYTDTFDTYQTSSVVSASQTSFFLTSSTSTTSTSTVTSTYISTFGTTTGSYPTSESYNSTDTSVAATGTWVANVTGRASIDWLAEVKGRAGITMDRTLLFATAGLAIGSITQETTGTLVVDGVPSSNTWTGKNSETRVGFVIGAGVEQALDDHWSVSAEGEYFNLGTATYDITSTGVPGSSGKATQVIDGGSFDVGVKYKF